MHERTQNATKRLKCGNDSKRPAGSLASCFILQTQERTLKVPNDLKDHITRKSVKWYSVFLWWNACRGPFLTHTCTDTNTHTRQKSQDKLSVWIKPYKSRIQRPVHLKLYAGFLIFCWENLLYIIKMFRSGLEYPW